MKITRLGPTRPVIGIGGLLGGGTSGGGGAGTVPTATGSNGGVSWSSNVGAITVNGTPVLGPYVDFANGSNTVVSVASNTIRVHATASVASPLTTKGDLYTYSTADARLAVGSNGTGLIADSTATTGNRWTTQAITGELLMQDGVTSPPVPIETETEDDWLYADL